MSYEKEVKVIESLIAGKNPLTGEYFGYDHVLSRPEVTSALWIALGALDDIAMRHKLTALQTRVRKLRTDNNLDPITGRIPK